MFWLRYLLALLFGTAAVYFLAPAAWEKFSQRDSGKGDFAFEEAAPAQTQKPAQRRPVRAAASPNAPRARAAAPAARPIAKAAAEAEPAAVTPAAREAAGAEPAQVADAPVEVVQVIQRRLSTDDVPQSSGDVIRWGVVMVESGVFHKDGRRLANKVPGGSLAEITKMASSSKGEMALCVLWDGRKWNGPFLVAASDICMFEGTREGMAADDVGKLVKYCRLNAALEARKQELREQEVNANPHAAKLRELDKKSQEFAEKVKALTERRDKAVGGERTRVADELRRLEATATKHNAEVARQVALYEEWKAKHPAPAKSPENDAKCRELASALDAMRGEVEMFGF